MALHLDDHDHVFQDLVLVYLNGDLPVCGWVDGYTRSVNKIVTSLRASSAKETLSFAKSSSLL